MKRAEKRDHLVKVAADLFNRHGYHGAGIDWVIAEAGIAKTTLYRHFKSKDELIVAVLKRLDDQFREDMRSAVDQASGDPADKILATFDFLETWFARPGFHGCPFVGAVGEFGDRSNPVNQEAAIHKRLMIAYYEELARAGGYDDPKGVAESVNLLHEGATTVAHVSGDPSPARNAKAMAAVLLGRPAPAAD